MLLEIIVDVAEDADVIFRTQMLAGSVEQVQIVLQRQLLELSGLITVSGKSLLGGTEPDVDGINVFDQIHDLFLVNEVRQPAAEVGCKVKLAVREGACTAESVHDRTCRAVDAFLYLSLYYRAFSVFQILALFQDQDLVVRCFLDQFISGI